MIVSQLDAVTRTKVDSQAHLGDHERFDLARVRDMWTDAEIDHWSTSVYRRRRAIRYLSFDEVLFVFVVLYWLLCLCWY